MKDSAYFVSPVSGPGPGLLVLHSWWGLTQSVKRIADRLSDHGYTVLVPDLLGGVSPKDFEAASAVLMEASPDRLAGMTAASARVLAEKSFPPGGPVGVVGFSMGASLGLWASVRFPDLISAVVAFYGAQAIDFGGASAAYQLHSVVDDPLVSDDEMAFMEATIGLAGADCERYEYPGVGHWFMEEERDEFDLDASDLAWERMIHFLRGTLNTD